MLMEYYAKQAKEVFNLLNTKESGLTKKEAEIRLDKFGYNELKKEKKNIIIKVFINQFKNIFLILLIFAALLSLFLSYISGKFSESYPETIALSFIIGLTIILGFVQEYRAEKALEALKKNISLIARVIRNDEEMEIPASNLVPGDIILLESGDIVPADSRLFHVSNLQVDESSLTGESVPAKKEIVPFKIGTRIADQDNMVFSGTIVTYGKARAIVVSTGMSTELGKIAKSITEEKETTTPLQIKFAKIAKQSGIGIISLIALILIIGILSNETEISKMIIFALSLIVAAVPNALPVIVTIGLSVGAKTLAKKNMLIKELPAAESLGSVTIICSDKTGTITKDEMTIKKIFADNEIIDVSGSGYEPIGKFSINGKEIAPKKIELLCRIGYLCNSSKLIRKNGSYEIIGDPTEGSLIVLANKGKFKEDYFDSYFTFIEELPFDSERKMMTSIFRNSLSKRKEAYTKGAPDLLIRKCQYILENNKIRKITKTDIEKVLDINDKFAKKALRVLGLAYKDVSDISDYSIKTVEKDLIFVGLVGMIDPPRAEVRESILKCEEAGIKIMMITGDYPATAKAVAEEIGLFKEKDIILTGEEMERMTDSQLARSIENIRIIARALPIQKVRIVEALRKNGHIVAMTGDGVNDAPALKRADIGIAMGITGTDVAKEVSKATLVDDNFATIVNAVEEGRNIYDKMIRSARYLLSCNVGEVLTVFIAIIINLPLPLIPLQILLMNLLTDGVPALGLGFESNDKSVMSRAPRDPKENPISHSMFMTILIFGLIMSAGTLWMFSQYKDIDLNKARTVAFTTLVMFEMCAVLSSKSLLPSLKRLNPFTNLWLLGAIILSVSIQALVIFWPPLQSIFQTVSLSQNEIIKILIVSFLGFIMMEMSKFIMKLEPKKESIKRGVRR